MEFWIIAIAATLNALLILASNRLSYRIGYVQARLEAIIERSEQE